MRLRISHFTPQMEVYLCASVGRCAGCVLLISRFIVWEVPVSSSLQSEKSCNLLWILKLDSLGVRHHFIFQSSGLLFWGTVIKPQEAADPRNAHCGHLFPICVGISLFSKIALQWSKQHVLFAKFQLKVEGWTIKIFCSPITHRDPVILGLPPLQGPLCITHSLWVVLGSPVFSLVPNTLENTRCLTILIYRLRTLSAFYSWLLFCAANGPPWVLLLPPPTVLP